MVTCFLAKLAEVVINAVMQSMFLCIYNTNKLYELLVFDTIH